MDRRRSASLAVLVVASLATLGTSQVATPPPTVGATLDGTFELTPDSPVGVQEFRVRLVGPGVESGQIPTVAFDPTALVTGSEEGEQLRLRVVAAAPDDPAQPNDSFRTFTEEKPNDPRPWQLSCGAGACEGRFALVAVWADPEAKATATVDWRLAATVNVWSGVAAGAPTARLTAESVDVADPHLNAQLAAGEPVRFDARNRLAQWRVSMRLGDGPLESTWGWPVVTTARLSATKSVIESPPDAEAGDALPFIEGVGDERRGGLAPDGAGEAIEFEPFWACLPGEECSAEYNVGLSWPDVRDGSVIEAGWHLDVRAIGIDGSDVPIEVDVEAVPPIAMVTGATQGTLVWTKGTRDEFRYSVEIPNPAEDDGSWDGLRVPSYGIWRATLRSTGSTPLPSDFAVNFGKAGSTRRISIDDGEVTSGFTLIEYCHFGDRDCRIDGNLAAGFDEDDLPIDAELTIDWELELAVGTTDPAGGALKIVDTSPSPSP
jgi:hypothetical protein